MSDLGFVLRAFRVTGIIRNVTRGYRSGPTLADVEINLGDGPFEAELKAWYIPLKVEGKVTVLAEGYHPDTVVLAGIWHLFYRSIIGIIVFVIVAIVDVVAFKTRRQEFQRRGSLLHW